MRFDLEVVVRRGAVLESRHRLQCAVADVQGALVGGTAEPGLVTTFRSSAKPFQLLPFVERGHAGRLGFGDEELAVMAASHTGSPRHLRLVEGILERVGLGPGHLACGYHEPEDADSRDDVLRRGAERTAIYNNCSGKHAGMLACCVLHGWSRADYLASGHPLQQAIRAAIGRLADVRVDDLVPVVDGCSAPNYALPLSRLALAFARIASGHPGEDAAACRTLAGAMVAHPEYVSGTGGGDLALMRSGRGAWISKVGAEGVQAIGLVHQGLGIAIKVADGGGRARMAIAVGVLDALGLLVGEAREELLPFATEVLHNARGTATGVLRSVVVLDKG